MFEDFKGANRPTRLTARRTIGSLTPVQATGPTVAEVVMDFANYHRNKGSAPSTIRQFLYFLDDRTPRLADYLPLLAWCKDNGITYMSELTKPRCQQWLDQMRAKSTGPSTKEKSVIALKRMLQWAFDSEVITEMPIKLKQPKQIVPEVKVFTSDEMQRITRVVQRENLRDWAIFCVLLDTGIRSNELINLKVDDVRLDRREMVVFGKMNKYRVVPLKDSVPALKAYLRERGEIPGCDWLFLSFANGASPVYAGGNGKKKRQSRNRSLRELFSEAPLTRVGLYHLVQKWGELANVTEARNSPHTYRHFFAVSYLRKSGDVFSLQRILGHAKLEMTLRYAKLAEVDVRRIHNAASPLTDYIPARNKRAVFEDEEEEEC